MYNLIAHLYVSAVFLQEYGLQSLVVPLKGNRTPKPGAEPIRLRIETDQATEIIELKGQEINNERTEMISAKSETTGVKHRTRIEESLTRHKKSKAMNKRVK